MLDEHDQLAVIRGLRDGSRDAWTALYDGYSADVWRYVGRLMGDRASETADVVQDTFLAAARSARQFDAERGSLWSWLTGIAHHQSAAAWRRIGRAARLPALVAERPAKSAVTESPDDAWTQREQADLVRSVLTELSGEQATLLTGKYLDELSLDTLAQRFGSSTEAIKSKLARGRREFRSRYEVKKRE